MYVEILTVLFALFCVLGIIAYTIELYMFKKMLK